MTQSRENPSHYLEEAGFTLWWKIIKVNLPVIRLNYGQDNERGVFSCYEKIMCELKYEGNNKTRRGVILSLTASPVLSALSMACAKIQDVSREFPLLTAVITSPKNSRRMHQEQVCTYKKRRKIVSYVCGIKRLNNFV